MASYEAMFHLEKIMNFVSRILYIDRPSPDGTSFSKEELETIATNFSTSSHPVFGVLKDDSDVSPVGFLDISTIATIINETFVDDEGLVAIHRVLDTDAGIKFKSIMEELNKDEPLISLTISPRVSKADQLKLIGAEFHTTIIE